MTMQEKIYNTVCGPIHYWIEKNDSSDITLVFLPGLTADHRLFDRQIEYFLGKYNLFVWDAPGHASSWPFRFDFTLMDKARWLHEILMGENLADIIIIGQSMGGYVGQAYAEQFYSEMKGFISIDSAPLQRKYMTSIEIGLLKRMEPIYRHYPWNALVKAGSNGVATSEYGRQLMRSMMQVYEKNQKRYAQIAGHGYRMLAQAIEADLCYKLPKYSLLICGKEDKAGSTERYNKAWTKGTGLPLVWIENAGHNSNTDQPERVNELIDEFVDSTIGREK